MELNAQQESTVLEMVAEKIADRYHDSVLNQLGMLLGEKFGMPIKMAAAITGWDVNWIRRNLSDKIVVAEGQNDAIELGDLIQAREDRKGGKAA